MKKLKCETLGFRKKLVSDTDTVCGFEARRFRENSLGKQGGVVLALRAECWVLLELVCGPCGHADSIVERRTRLLSEYKLISFFTPLIENHAR